jgi:signal transduction histidine kinase
MPGSERVAGTNAPSQSNRPPLYYELIAIEKPQLKRPSSLPARSASFFFISVQCLLLAYGSCAHAAGPILTNAADVISLPADEAARHLSALVHGVVTAADPTLKGRFFLQDATGGVFVDNADGHRPEPGDVVEVSGISEVGAYAPIISNPQVRIIGKAPLPTAKIVPIEQLMSGAEDSQRVEVSGIVRAARMDRSHLVADVASGGYRFRVYAPIIEGMDPQKLVGAGVRVRGTAAEAHNRSLRQLIAVELYVPSPADFTVEKPESADPFGDPPMPLNTIAQYRRDSPPGKRVHVQGTVTLQRPGEDLFIQDASGGLRIQTRELGQLAPGDVIEAVGFPEIENFLPVLQDGVFKRTVKPKVALKPKTASIEELQQGLHYADFVVLKAKLIDHAVRKVHIRAGDKHAMRTILMLQSTSLVFTAEVETPAQEAELTGIPIGSSVEVSGVCLTESGDDGKMKSLQVLLPGSGSVRILARPSWFTPQRLLIGFGILACILIIIASWTVMVSKKNSVLNYLIQEREKAQVELQRAHDQLEARVKERTAELKFQITARKESELQFKAVLGERTRLAQELHDTLEQTLTGIALQLDTAARLFQRNPENAGDRLELARNLIRQSQVELRRSVWDLRCRALEQFDLPGALLRSGRQITYGTGIHFEVETKGQVRILPEVMEENLLRMGQEALTNVIKHSSANLASMELEFNSEKVILLVKDDGKGFVPENCIGPRDGHFGLLGMTERAKRLGGQVLISSVPGSGTSVRIEIPLSAQPGAVPVVSDESANMSSDS